MMPWIRAFISDCIDAVIKWIKRVWFESKLKARLTMIEWQNKIEFRKRIGR